jgi:hypothetical protein
MTTHTDPTDSVTMTTVGAARFGAEDEPLLDSADLPDSLGPFQHSPIVFGGGVPVGGWAQLTLHRNGAYNYSGHFHDSGGTSYNVAQAFGVRDAKGTVYTFGVAGRVHGTFEPGSRDFDWNQSGTNPALAAGWADLCREWRWQSSASARLSLAGVFDIVIGSLGPIGTIIKIVG